MKPPIFVRTLSKKERKALQERLRSKDAFILPRCQILLASARGEIAPQIAENLGCASQTVRDAIHDFNRRGLDALVAGSSRPSIRTPLSAKSKQKLSKSTYTTLPGSSPETLLGAYELADRVCGVFGCTHEPHLSIPQEVA